MPLNGKRDVCIKDDFNACTRRTSMKRGRAKEIVQQVKQAVLGMKFADESGVPLAMAEAIAKAQRIILT
jgi:hypothetical protein